MTGTASRLEGLRVRAEPAAEQVLQEGVGRVTVILSTPEVPGTTHGPSEDTGAVPRRAVLRMESAHPGGMMPGTREPVAMLSPATTRPPQPRLLTAEGGSVPVSPGR